MISFINEKIVDPTASIWISASAGTGKTKSLIDRILALLLQGTKPDKILCLTYTKAAAHEMLDRLAKKIEEMHNLQDILLPQFPLVTKKFIDKLYEQSLSSKWVSIQTIHSFCLSILKQTTLETSLYPNIELCDELLQNQLVSESIKKIFDDRKYHNDLKTIMTYSNDFPKILLENFSEIYHFLSLSLDIPTYYSDVFQIDPKYLKMNHQKIIQHLFKKIFDNSQSKVFQNLLEKLRKSPSKTDLENANILSKQTKTPNEYFIDVFLTKDGEIRKKLCAKEIENIALQDMQENANRALNFAAQLNTINTAKANISFFRVAQAVVEQYQKIKAYSHRIDYNDIISHSITLLHNFDWIMYKIDSQIDHVLIDEAQDTSPEQWEIIKLITQEFFINYQSNKTVFVVGDEKQSIFSFQGANVEYFREMHRYFKQACENSGAKFYDITLSKSYRTSGNILRFVDHIFCEIFKGIHHETTRNSNEGIIKINPLIELDIENSNKAEFQLVADIVNTIDNALKNNLFIPSKQRCARPSDFMILFRKRNHFLIHMIRSELKKRRIPVAEIDKIKLNDELAIEDLICFAKFTQLPQDDLICACTLKSSLIGISEEELMKTAVNRGKQNLWDHIQHTDLYKKYNLDNLQSYIDNSKTLSPYQFFLKILNDGGFEKIVSRLGSISVSYIHEFLNLTNKYSQTHAPILQNFLHYFDTTNVDVKHDISNQNNEVQLVTVHGSKGLQAPFIILADANASTNSSVSIIKNCIDIRQNNYNIFWKLTNNVQPEIIKKTIAESKERENNEAWRLLYVALTRAEDFLYVFGIQKEKGINPWYKLLSEKFSPEFDTNTFSYLKFNEKIQTKNNETLNIPEWFYQKVPSNKIEISNADSIEITYGNYVHEILSLRESDINNILYFRYIINQISKKYDLSPELKIQAQNEAFKVIENFPHIFSKKSLSEVDILFNNQRFRIDKIFFNNNELWIIDFKTGKRDQPSIREYSRQLQAYKNAIKTTRKYDNYSIKKAILWTKELMCEELF